MCIKLMVLFRLLLGVSISLGTISCDKHENEQDSMLHPDLQPAPEPNFEHPSNVELEASLNALATEATELEGKLATVEADALKMKGKAEKAKTDHDAASTPLEKSKYILSARKSAEFVKQALVPDFKTTLDALKVRAAQGETDAKAAGSTNGLDTVKRVQLLLTAAEGRLNVASGAKVDTDKLDEPLQLEIKNAINAAEILPAIQGQVEASKKLDAAQKSLDEAAKRLEDAKAAKKVAKHKVDAVTPVVAEISLLVSSDDKVLREAGDKFMVAVPEAKDAVNNILNRSTATFDSYKKKFLEIADKGIAEVTLLGEEKGREAKKLKDELDDAIIKGKDINTKIVTGKALVGEINLYKTTIFDPDLGKFVKSLNELGRSKVLLSWSLQKEEKEALIKHFNEVLSPQISEFNKKYLKLSAEIEKKRIAIREKLGLLGPVTRFNVDDYKKEMEALIAQLKTQVEQVVNQEIAVVVGAYVNLKPPMSPTDQSALATNEREAKDAAEGAVKKKARLQLIHNGINAVLTEANLKDQALELGKELPLQKIAIDRVLPTAGKTSKEELLDLASDLKVKAVKEHTDAKAQVNSESKAHIAAGVTFTSAKAELDAKINNKKALNAQIENTAELAFGAHIEALGGLVANFGDDTKAREILLVINDFAAKASNAVFLRNFTGGAGMSNKLDELSKKLVLMSVADLSAKSANNWALPVAIVKLIDCLENIWVDFPAELNTMRSELLKVAEISAAHAIK